MDRRTTFRFISLATLTLAAALICLFLGPTGGADWNIIREVRLPRVLLGLLVGGGLATAGAVLQGILRNPLADPFIMGTSSAATAGVMVAGLLGLGGYSGLYLMALGFAVFSIFLVYRIATVANRTPVQTMILAGVIVSLFFNAVVFVFFSIFFREQIAVLYYLLGTLTEGDSIKLAISAVIILLGIGVTWFLGRDLDLLTQGEAAAFHLGVRTELTKRILFVAASAMVAASVAVAGLIGFVGLIVPHMMIIIISETHAGRRKGHVFFLRKFSRLSQSTAQLLTTGSCSRPTKSICRIKDQFCCLKLSKLCRVPEFLPERKHMSLFRSPKPRQKLYF